MKHIKRFSLIFVLLGFIGCSLPSGTKNNAFLHISIDKIINKKNDEELHAFKCLETSNALNKNYSFKPKGLKKLHFFFFCKPTVLGEALNLKIYYDGGLVQTLDSVASRVKNDQADYKVDSWLVDANQDSSLDLVQRTYSLTDPTKDLIKLSVWKHSKKAMVRKDLTSEEESLFKERYSVTKF